MASSRIDIKQQLAEVEVSVAEPVLEVEDAVDRASRHRHLEPTRIPLRRIGLWPGNVVVWASVADTCTASVKTLW